ncbi:MAG: LysM peptidoglycan-binding domain-containing protein [Prochlorococcus marinus CUG1435]|nr:LysM peptidoglycan-binding domain-containing protein [Prochlorococcus marinus CUG1435]
MKLLFLVIAILLNFFNDSSLKSVEKIDSGNNKIENISERELTPEDKTEIRKIHIVKIGDTISSISKLYSINKDLIIELNKLKNENYIYVGQNLIISESNNNLKKQSDLISNYHIVQIGENLTEISNKYKLELGYLIEINNLMNPDSLKVGQKLFLSKNKTTSSENNQISKNNNELLELDKQIYGPIIIQNKSYKKIRNRKVLNVLNQENKKLILSINCDTNEINVRIPGRKWRGSEPAKEEFENNLINDFC